MRRLVLLPVLALALAGCAAPAEDEGPAGSGINAEVMCEEFVKQEPGISADPDFSGQEHRASDDDTFWIVTGEVDGRGYRCDLARSGDDEWTASEVFVE